MKRLLCLLAAFSIFFCGISAHAQEYGKIRALKERAAFVTKQKNDFVARVLASYAIPFEKNGQGVVVRISVDGQWQDISSVEIVPVLIAGSDRNEKVAYHELFFFTPNGILDVVSELTIR